MSTELLSLTKEEIKQRELSHRDLWIIKLGDEIKGPYEVDNLKSYIQENESLFEEALASRMEPQEWNPLFSYPQFQRRSPQIINQTDAEGPFWIYENGLKAGPFEKLHILKRLEMNSLIVTDKISIDDGKSWMAIYQFPDFDRREFSAQELPVAPLEQTLAQIHGKDAEEKKEEASEILATAAHRGLYKNKVLQFKATNYSLPENKSSFWSNSLPDWFMPSAIALGVMVIGGVIFTLTPGQESETLSVADITEQSRPLQQKRTVAQPNPSAQLGRTNRIPASVKNTPAPRARRSAGLERLKVRDNVPTTIESHHVDRYPSNTELDPEFGHYEEPYTDPYDNPFNDEAIVHEAPPAASLVPPRARRQPTSVSEVMGYEEDMVEEASDF